MVVELPMGVESNAEPSAFVCAMVADILVRLAQLATDHPQIAEMETNPLIVHLSGAVAVDARVRVD